MSTIRARLIQGPEVRNRIVLSPPAAPALKGDGSLDIVCGGCGTTLVQSAQPHLALHAMLIRCPKCRQCNDLSPAVQASPLSPRHDFGNEANTGTPGL